MNAGMKRMVAAVLCACMLCAMACVGLAEGWDDGGWDAGGWDDGGSSSSGDSDSGGGVPAGMGSKGRSIRLPVRRLRSVGIVPMPVDEAGMDPAAADSVVVAAAENDAAPVIEDSMAEELLNVLGNDANRNSVEYAAYLSLATKLGLGDSAEEIVETLKGIVNR